ncbi:MAG: helix-turn-helix transcriptional regulator [Clostridia bacterium]|nr:helix-turn-helix transcriptional regulator [Clostridia bacterium]
MKVALKNIEYYKGIGFPKDKKSLHSHTFDEISLISSGEITYISDDIITKVSGKSLICSKAYHLHNPYISPDTLYERYQIFVHFENLYDAIPAVYSMSTPSFIAPLTDDEYSELYHYFFLLKSVYVSPYTEDSVLRAKLILGVLYMKIYDIFSKTDLTPVKLTGTYINDVISFIELHYAEKITLENLASEFFVSRTKLAGDFKKTTGMTVNSFHILTRLKNAKFMLESGLSVTETAERCGFTSSAYFINTFVAHNKITPYKYRQLMKQK